VFIESPWKHWALAFFPVTASIYLFLTHLSSVTHLCNLLLSLNHTVLHPCSSSICLVWHDKTGLFHGHCRPNSSGSGPLTCTPHPVTTQNHWLRPPKHLESCFYACEKGLLSFILSVYLHATNLLPPDRFISKLIYALFFLKPCDKNWVLGWWA